MTTLYKLRDYKEAYKFEKEHPKQIRWDEKYKTFVLSQGEGVQGIWFKDKTELIAEMIMTWTSNNVVHGDSITVMSSHRGQGIAHDLVKESLDWASESGFEYFIGEARKGASWKVFQDFGAEEILVYKNWSKTGEEYVSFKITL
jgi:predicted GNAT family acetyltransferase